MMTKRTTGRWRPTLVLAALLSLSSVALAQDGVEPHQAGGYELSWRTVDVGGANPREGSGYTLGGTVGQPDGAVWQGGDYVLEGGFWTEGGRTPSRVPVGGFTRPATGIETLAGLGVLGAVALAAAALKRLRA